MMWIVWKGVLATIPEVLQVAYIASKLTTQDAFLITYRCLLILTQPGLFLHK